MSMKFTANLAVISIVLIISGCVSGEKELELDKSKAFKVRGYHQHFFNAGSKLEEYKKRLDLLAELDYNLVVFGFSHPGRSAITMGEDWKIETVGCSKENIKELIDYALKKGLEPVFEIKFVGKQLPLVKHLLKEHPDLVIDKSHKATVLNLKYESLPGVNAYKKAVLPQIDFLLSLYPENHPAKYFHLGIDEFNADDMGKLAESLNVSPAKAFAMSLEQGTEFLLKKGVTPLIWGDILLSKKLGMEKHGISVPGFKEDPRLKLGLGSSYHGDFRSDKSHNLFQMVNHLKNKDKIIVVDWHYQPSATEEYPSVDYFQNLGFKDVWGAPWYRESNIRQFAKYASSRHCGGMVATAWHFASMQNQILEHQAMVYKSSTYFLNPNFIPPKQETFSYTISDENGKILSDAASTGFIPSTAKTLTFKTQKPADFATDKHKLFFATLDRPLKGFEFPIKNSSGRDLELKFEIPSEVCNRKTPTQLMLQIAHVNSNNHYFILQNSLQGFICGKKDLNPSISSPNNLLTANFAEMDTEKKDYLWFDGSCATPIRIKNKSKAPIFIDGGLNVGGINCAFATPSELLINKISKSMNIHMEVKMTQDSSKSFCALLTRGSYFSGFRILVSKDRLVLFQIANQFDGNPLWLYANKKLPMNDWASIDISYKAARGGEPGKATLSINGSTASETDVPRAVDMEQLMVFGIGCEIKGTPLIGQYGRFRPNFPGLIRKITIKP